MNLDLSKIVQNQNQSKLQSSNPPIINIPKLRATLACSLVMLVMGSLGPFGNCKHISALRCALEEYSRIRTLQIPTACTSELHLNSKHGISQGKGNWIRYLLLISSSSKRSMGRLREQLVHSHKILAHHIYNQLQS